MEEALARENMLAALNRVERNGGAPGVDGVPTERLRDQIHAEWSRIRNELLQGTYKPQPVRRGHGAVRRARQYVEEGYGWVVDMDWSHRG